MTIAGHNPTVRHMQPPVGLLLVTLGLMLLGLVMVASTTVSIDRPLFGGSLWGRPFGRQLIFVAIGVVVMLATMHACRLLFGSPRWIRFLVFSCAVVAVVGLVAALLPGLADPHRGSNRWLRVGVGGFSFGVQPSALAKLALVGLLAWLLTRDGVDVQSFRGAFLPAALVIGTFVALVGKEDFGTSALLAVIGGGMMFVAGCRRRYLGALVLVGAVGMAGLIYIAPYRMERITAFLDIWADPQGHGYQPLQSLTAIASGGWTGSGLGGGIQKYGYLPESHTDFIFSTICEEMGALGGFLIIALYGAILWVGARATCAARTSFERLLGLGLTLLITLQAAMNIAVVTVMTPTTGISLPLVSAGGSGLLTYSMVVGALAAVAARASQPMVEPSARASVQRRRLAEAAVW